MLELALHILDIAENSIRAGAKLIRILIREDETRDLFLMRITDNGHGMSPEEQKKALDPFYTTKKVRRIGMGLPLLSDAAERTGGKMILRSKPGVGTVISAEFGLSHIDRQPMGDIPSVLIAIIVGNPGSDLIYRHEVQGRIYLLDTRNIKEALEDVPLNHPEVVNFLREHIMEGLSDIGAAA
ncbi:Histidine kinase-, DNA gyrase B-, and HSP90-like ATPase [Syntrophus gentianae]|uniref:histidine kinase n=1 Tax=Syntrophus gentianae TaxID=43775 RepID=A0A1H7WCB1_9BACT|nr:ATP-binding protein [Syntrophus gentianae]SEM18699.1 Histidine kinase-, DNA gyrase B-, and HSP90-like ATPase [Syntrophus gentianae]